MRTIIRCPSCFTYVYSDARRCHGCGERIGKRRLLTRGSIIFALLAVAGYTVARGIDLHQDKNRRVHREMEAAAEVETVSKFVRVWIGSSPEEIAALFTPGKPFAGEVVKLRSRYPNLFPATPIGVNLEELSSVYHRKDSNGNVVTAGWEAAQGGHTKLSARRVPPKYDDRKRGVSWYATPYKFVAEMTRENAQYTVHGTICVSEGVITCLSIDRIESIEGVVQPVD